MTSQEGPNCPPNSIINVQQHTARVEVEEETNFVTLELFVSY